MRRRLFTILSVVSLVLCIVTLALWARSYWAGDSFGIGQWTVDRADTQYVQWTATGMATGGGHFAFGTLTNGLAPSPSAQKLPARWFWGWGSGGLLQYRSLAGLNPGPIGLTHLAFRLTFSTNPYGSLLILPGWFLALLFGVLPAIRHRLAGRWRRQSRSRQGLCITCGYDLRASQDRCPECSTPIPVDLVRKPIQ